MALNEATPSLFHSSLAGEPSKTFNSSLFSTSLSLGHSISLCPSIPSSIPQAPLNFGLPNNATSRPHVISVPSTQPSSLVQCLPSWLIQPKSAPFDKVINPFLIEQRLAGRERSRQDNSEPPAGCVSSITHISSSFL